MTFTHTRRAHLTGLIASLGVGATGASASATSPFEGTWTGLLESGRTRLTVRLVVADDRIDVISVDQGGAVITPDEVTLTADRIRLVSKRINASFDGHLTPDGFIDGTFTQGQVFHMRLARGMAIVPSSAWRRLTPESLNAHRIEAKTPAIGAAWASRNGSDLIVRGARSSDDEIAAQPEDQWHWGSITKSMTATLCARLVEAGVIKWDTTIGQVLDTPDFSVPEAYRDATLLHLLSHRSGLQPNVNGVEFSHELDDARKERLRFARTALAFPPADAIGKQMVYSNNGYAVAGAMLEKLTGTSWETLIQTEVFKPLGIRHAGQGAPGRKGQIDQPLGHTVKDGIRVPDPAGVPGSDNVVAIGPAGRVHMPLADMITYLTAHRDQPAKFLKAQNWAMLHIPHFGGNYALGWMKREDGALFHNGSNTMWYAEVLIDPNTGVVCAACANDAARDTMGAVSEVLMSAYGSATA
ncbi:serine hydrolase domain-containing protein [Asticcacaulis tiandongensis]|uniref:serine hydrolase domain-containing protein n=1 Tax=Asticcacaulis tiandongensis TaxID=2565365 RepID=UPI0011260CF0|nr:serine hydrolase [Asticcacaulis tiandongensis]